MEDLIPRWETAARRLLAQKMALDDEVNKERGLSVCELLPVFGLVPSVSVSKPPFLHQAEQIKRTHDYTPFIQRYVTKLYHAGILHDLLEMDENGKPPKAPRQQE